MRHTTVTAAAIALALTANDAVAFRIPVTSRAIKTGRRGATVRFATAEELLAQAQALRDEGEHATVTRAATVYVAGAGILQSLSPA